MPSACGIFLASPVFGSGMYQLRPLVGLPRLLKHKNQELTGGSANEMNVVGFVCKPARLDRISE